MTTYIVRLTDEDVETVKQALAYMEEYYDEDARYHTLDADLERVKLALRARVELKSAMDDVQEEDGTV